MFTLKIDLNDYQDKIEYDGYKNRNYLKVK